MEYAIIIPARFASKRLPGKPLLLIKGVPMLIRTYKQCKKVKEKINPDFMAVVLPLPENDRDRNVILKSFSPYKLVKKISFKNGGIPVFFMIFCKQQS